MNSHNSSGHNERVCPWWMAYTFDNPLRRLFHRPDRMFAPYLQSGMTALDIGCGMGFFSIGMAKLVGPTGVVFSVDLQQKMLDVMMKRARRAGVAQIIKPALCTATDIRVEEPVDFALGFWMVHEVPDRTSFMAQLAKIVKPGGWFLMAEPSLHVSEESFQESARLARQAGFVSESGPDVRLSLSAIFRRS